MKEHPILFSTPMVQALLEGRKTQTRRIHKNPPKIDSQTGDWLTPISGEVMPLEDWIFAQTNFSKYKKGDLLWVRETYKPKQFAGNKIDGYDYKADHVTWLEKSGQSFTKNSGCEFKNGYSIEHWKPSIFMPKAAARIWLEITDIKVERLQEISQNDCVNEGIQQLLMSRMQKATAGSKRFRNYLDKSAPFQDAVIPYESFKSLWQYINGEKSWIQNPWVWAITFKRVNHE